MLGNDQKYVRYNKENRVNSEGSGHQQSTIGCDFPLFVVRVVSGVWLRVVGDHGKGLMWERLGEER